MKVKTLKIGLFVPMLIFALCLAGCSGGSEQTESVSQTSDDSIMHLTLRDGSTEELKGEELADLAEENAAAIEKYNGAFLETIAKVEKVESLSELVNHKTDGGFILLDNRVMVEYPNDAKDFVAELRKGDKVKATGYIVMINSSTVNGANIMVFHYDNPFQFEDGYRLNETPTTIEGI